MRTTIKALGSAAALASTVLLASSSFTLPAQAQAQARSEKSRTCFRVQDITGIAPASNLGADRRDGVNVRVNSRDFYQLEVLQPCGPQLDDSQQIGVVSRGGSSFICANADAEVIAKPQSLPTTRCTVTKLRKLDVAEVASLPAGQKP